MNKYGHIRYTMFDSGGRLCVGNITGPAKIIKKMKEKDIKKYNTIQNPLSQFLEVIDIVYYKINNDKVEQ